MIHVLLSSSSQQPTPQPSLMLAVCYCKNQSYHMLSLITHLPQLILLLPPPPLSFPSPHSEELNKHLLMSTWSGMLAALSLLLDACGDEMITENILKAHLNYIHLCGRYHLAAPRDAFLTSLCRSALPGHYAMTLVTGPTSAHSMFTAIGDHPDQDRGNPVH